MKEELKMLRLAQMIENGTKVPADGYTKQVGYTKPVGYSAPIGNMNTKSESEAALEAAALVDKGNPTEKQSEQPTPTVEVQEIVRQEVRSQPIQPVGNKSFIDRVKEKPAVYAVIIAVLAFFGYKIFTKK
jgi:hypothetical protein